MAIFTPITWNAGDVITAANVNRLETGLSAIEAAKQDKLVYDSVPTQNSLNSLTSGAVYTAINNMIHLPAVTSSDKGKFLVVNSSGDWAATSIAIAEENTF